VTDDSERMIGALLQGNHIENISAASIATAPLTQLFGDNGVALATPAMTTLVLVFGEVLPKTYAITNAETAATRVAPLIRIVIIVFSPVVTLVRAPVRGDAENIPGVIHAKDLLREVDRLVRGADGSPAALANLDVLKIAI
jgi:Mg2+/Co2+ transporter CorB